MVCTCIVPGWKRLFGHLCRLSSHLVLPFVLNLCSITHGFVCNLWVAALYEQLACDWMSLVASSVSAAGVSGMVFGRVARCVVMPRCKRGCPFDLPVRHLCWACGHSTLIILLTCRRKCWRLCPRLHLTNTGLPSCCGLGAGVVCPIIWYMMNSSIHVRPLDLLCLFLGGCMCMGMFRRKFL